MNSLADGSLLPLRTSSTTLPVTMAKTRKITIQCIDWLNNANYLSGG